MLKPFTQLRHQSTCSCFVHVFCDYDGCDAAVLIKIKTRQCENKTSCTRVDRNDLTWVVMLLSGHTSVHRLTDCWQNTCCFSGGYH